MAQRKPDLGPRILAILTLSAAYWAVVLVFALAQMWVICNPHVTACPTMLDATVRAGGVLLVGLGVYVPVVWISLRASR